MKTMKMNKETDTNLAGIYAKKSTEITAAGDGLTLREVKSPVIETEIDNSNKNEENENKYVKKENETNDSTLKSDVLEIDVSKASLYEHVDDENNLTESREKLNKSDEIIELDSSDNDDKMSHHSSEKQKEIPLVKDLNYALIPFPRCEEYYGSERWGKALQTMQRVGYVTWEINTMLGALDKNLESKFGKRKLPPFRDDVINKPRLSDQPKKKPGPNFVSGVLHQEKYFTFDLRANIGDARHPNFHILPEFRNLLYIELHKLLQRSEWMPHEPFVCCHYINQLLMVECRNQRILDHIVMSIHQLNHIGADFVMIPRSCESKNILIYIPYSFSDTKKVLDIIKQQNRLAVNKWKVKSSEKCEGGICLDVIVDGGTYLRLMQDQDDLFFLMKRATIKLPANVEDDS